MSNQNSDLQRKAGFFHSLGKVITESGNSPGNENYKSAHNVRSSEVWMDEIPIAIYGSASLYSDGVVVRQIGSASINYNDPLNQFASAAYLYPLAQSNYQTWFLDTGTPSATVDGFLPSNEWVKPLINPSDVPDSNGAPSLGYQLRLYKNDGTTFISYGAANYDVDYFSGLIRFDPGKTPIDASNGLGFQFSQSSFQAILPVSDATRKAYIQNPSTAGPRAVAWQYVGQRLSNYTFTGGGSFSFVNSSTIGFTQSGITYSAYVIDGSLTASSLNTGSNGGATAGYSLSVDSSGNFVWTPSISGSSGTSGYDGSSGTSGSSGSSGTSGSDGSSGTSGSSGSSGTSGSDGSSGTSGISASVEFHNTDTITFATQSISGGLSASATINLGSLTASHLNTGSNGGATAGYILSNTGDGSFSWIPSVSSSSLSVSDYSNGTTFSNIQNIIFRGGLVTTPNYGGTAMGVLAGSPTSSNSVTVWIPAPPAAVYASHFTSNTDGNTDGRVTRTLSTSTVRISTPTSEGTPFETGSYPNTAWAGTNQAATTTSTPTFQTTGLVTGFSANSGGDARIIVDVFRGNGTATFSTYTTPTLYQNGTHTNSAGITVTIGSYAVDDSGFPAIYPSKYKATVSISVNMATIFSAYSLDGGRYSVRIKFITDTATDGGNTYTATSNDVFYDTNLSSPPSISGSTTIIESTNSSNIITKHISGVEYYTTGSQFELTTTGINNLNRNTQGYSNGTSKNFTITAPNYNLPLKDLQAWSPTVGSFVGWLNNYDNTSITYSYTSWAISASSTFRYRGAAAVASAQPFDPWGSGSAANSTGASVLIDQVSDNSTRLGDSFTGEDKRLVRGSSTFSAWDSTATLGINISNQTGTGPFCDACVVGGYLVRPDKYWLSAGLSTLQPNLTSYKPDKNGTNPDYSGSGYQTKATYHRMWYTSDVRNISSFQMTFSGQWPVSYPDANSALVASQLKIYIRRVSSPTGNFGPTAPPLALHGGLYNSGGSGAPFDDGNSGVDTPGSLVRTSVGATNNIINGTFGIYPANVGFWMELQIVDSGIKLDYINVTLNFSSGTPTTDSSAVGAG